MRNKSLENCQHGKCNVLQETQSHKKKDAKECITIKKQQH